MQSDIGSQASDFFPSSDIGSIVSSIVSAGIVIAALAALVFLLMGAVTWITSGGDKQKTEAAQKQITNAIIGLIIAVAAFAIWTAAKSFLGLDDSIITSPSGRSVPSPQGAPIIPSL